jgi:2-polyprenyl-3-methyl-5-hydroxy-6-metoxy-1,4-benzoquinol methylase
MAPRALSAEQARQDSQYTFPYHYISRFRNGFSCTAYDAYGLVYMSLVRFLLERLEELHPSRIVDVGCGDGRLARELSLSFPESEVVGIDYSQRAIALARALNPGRRFVCADIVSEPVEGRFDTVLCIEVFEHIAREDAGRFAECLSGLCAPGGSLLITAPHRNKKLSSKHVQHFTAESLYGYFEPFCTLEQRRFLHRAWYPQRFLRMLLKNKLFLLNNAILLDWVFRVYVSRCLHASERDCGRLFLRLAPRQ